MGLIEGLKIFNIFNHLVNIFFPSENKKKKIAVFNMRKLQKQKQGCDNIWKATENSLSPPRLETEIKHLEAAKKR